MTPNIPTSEECSANSKVFERGNEVGYACWYPQMGGYCGKAVFVFEKTDGNTCFDVYVWHDGEFPFGDGEPVRIHHCDAEQFIRFGNQVKKVMSFDDDSQSTRQRFPR